jgi:hypothetical protein
MAQQCQVQCRHHLGSRVVSDTRGGSFSASHSMNRREVAIGGRGRGADQRRDAGVSGREGVLPLESVTPRLYLLDRRCVQVRADGVTRCRGRRGRRHDQAQEGRTKVNAPSFRQSHASLSRNTNDRCRHTTTLRLCLRALKHVGDLHRRPRSAAGCRDAAGVQGLGDRAQ